MGRADSFERLAVVAATVSRFLWRSRKVFSILGLWLTGAFENCVLGTLLVSDNLYLNNASHCTCQGIQVNRELGYNFCNRGVCRGLLLVTS